MRILHIYETEKKLLPLFSGIKTVLQEQIRQENKINGICSKILIIDKNIKSEVRKDEIYLYGGNKEVILRYEPDFVVFHSFYFFSHFLLALFLKKKGIKYYIKPHGSFNKISQKNSIIKYLKKIIARFLFFNFYVKNANGIIYLNKEEQQNSIYIKKYSNQKNIILKNGILPFENIENKKNFSDEIVLSFLGRIDFYHKGIDKFIKVLEKNEEFFLKNNVNIQFFGGGEEKEEEKLKKKIKNKKYIKYLGRVEDEIKKNRILRKTDIFVLTSRYEGLPMSILESLRMGTPCFVTKETGMAEIIEKYECGWVNYKDNQLFDDLKKGIILYKKNKLRYSKNALDSIREFEWSKVLKEYEEEYKHC